MEAEGEERGDEAKFFSCCGVGPERVGRRSNKKSHEDGDFVAEKFSTGVECPSNLD